MSLRRSQVRSLGRRRSSRRPATAIAVRRPAQVSRRCRGAAGAQCGRRHRVHALPQGPRGFRARGSLASLVSADAGRRHAPRAGGLLRFADVPRVRQGSLDVPLSRPPWRGRAGDRDAHDDRREGVALPTTCRATRPIRSSSCGACSRPGPRWDFACRRSNRSRRRDGQETRQGGDGERQQPRSVHPGRCRKYEAMRAAIMAVLPQTSPGITVAELKAGVLPRLPDPLFPAGARAGWWLRGSNSIWRQGGDRAHGGEQAASTAPEVLHVVIRASATKAGLAIRAWRCSRSPREKLSFLSAFSYT